MFACCSEISISVIVRNFLCFPMRRGQKKLLVCGLLGGSSSDCFFIYTLLSHNCTKIEEKLQGPPEVAEVVAWSYSTKSGSEKFCKVYWKKSCAGVCFQWDCRLTVSKKVLVFLRIWRNVSCKWIFF